MDGYLAVNELDGLVRRYGLVSDGNDNVTVRATSMDRGVLAELAGESVLAAIDLVGSVDSRERAAGLERLDTALEHLGG